ncbi:DNA mismatch repair endonuclease MutL [Rheinheimera sp. MMS21-TC3]|uniref:DNA mismatch repair endonuclease MutL n=1 Tax=Rheinheimera sp. MMS21-TC3 TaxID=3072790 RepID=UPI0028C433E5|nr:DNA mismatch repair endonuclease MutL [Rheinheimera sp. MMS21-TC3]WNO60175.1 DNA mismatch repair endonuclease MutL [Rheinheimera sp. MMS21-TC3]
MSIQILSPQLANQIAAGEVVERPASVVKELVENSLDAGALHIEIDIEKGGSKLIRVRDNGSGIAEHDLVLALSRHATSKITNLDDLEAISSLGFRGEALASISSVSRLTLTSRTEQQTAAWQASAAGRDMQVDIRPAAHPVGTSIEVVDLFFNTPARRKFLRTDKTEFGHIDELIKRLALSRYDVSWLLTHNGQRIRQLKPALTAEQRQQRVAALCSKAFAEHAAEIENSYQGIKLWGWILHPDACQPQLNCQYSYVNGRMMRDKLLNHAIRQAYGERLSDDKVPAFVLYLEIDPRQVDVNVHPAKHEVRFHQSRLIHDFVVSALADALRQLEPEQQSITSWPQRDKATAAQMQPSYSASETRLTEANEAQPQTRASRSYSYAMPTYAKAKPGIAQLQQQHHYLSSTAETAAASLSTMTAELIADNRYWIRQHQGQIMLIDLLITLIDNHGLTQAKTANLLLPLRFNITDEQIAILTTNATAIKQYGFDSVITDKLLIIKAVPVWLRHTNINQWFPEILQQLAEDERLSATDSQSKSNNSLGYNLLFMLLDGDWLDAKVLLENFSIQLNKPELWHAVPLQLQDSIKLLSKQNT